MHVSEWLPPVIVVLTVLGLGGIIGWAVDRRSPTASGQSTSFGVWLAAVILFLIEAFVLQFVYHGDASYATGLLLVFAGVYACAAIALIVVAYRRRDEANDAGSLGLGLVGVLSVAVVRALDVHLDPLVEQILALAPLVLLFLGRDLFAPASSKAGQTISVSAPPEALPPQRETLDAQPGSTAPILERP